MADKNKMIRETRLMSCINIITFGSSISSNHYFYHLLTAQPNYNEVGDDLLPKFCIFSINLSYNQAQIFVVRRSLLSVWNDSF